MHAMATGRGAPHTQCDGEGRDSWQSTSNEQAGYTGYVQSRRYYSELGVIPPWYNVTDYLCLYNQGGTSITASSL